MTMTVFRFVLFPASVIFRIILIVSKMTVIFIKYWLVLVQVILSCLTAVVDLLLTYHLCRLIFMKLITLLFKLSYFLISFLLMLDLVTIIPFVSSSRIMVVSNSIQFLSRLLLK